MTVPRHADVLVVGAGPAGAVTARKLASAGADVLIADEPPAYGPHDMIVSAAAVSGLTELGISLPPGRAPGGIDLKLGGAPWRTLEDSEAVSCDRALLRAALLESARASGAVRLTGTASRPVRQPGGYLATVGREEVTARHVVLATGAAGAGSVHAAPDAPEWARGPQDPPPGAGMACARRFAVTGPASGIRLLMTMPDVDGDGDPPVSVWAVPGPQGTVTIGAARIGAGHEEAGAGELMASALRALAAADRRMAGARPLGPLVSGPLSSGFSPQLVASAGTIVVGEAAGLASPFTGEGLSAAIHSGLLASGAIEAHPGDPDAARRAYARGATGAFVGYFEAARHATRRYQLTWRVLSSAADSDLPFFAKARRAIVAPEGRRGPAPAMPGLAAADMPVAAPFLASCDEVALTTIRREWPSLAHILLAGGGLGQDGLRPARLVLAGLLSGQDKADIRLATPAAAIELATLGALAFIGAPRAAAAARRGVDWATATTVLVGDFLISQASLLIAEATPEISWSFADWLAELTTLRAAPPGMARQDSALAVFGALLEFPARIGAVLGGAPPAAVQALRDAGHHCGHALLHAEDVLLLSGRRNRLDTSLAAAIGGRISAIPDLLDGRPVSPESLATDPALRSAALAGAEASCRRARDDALRAAVGVPGTVARRMLRQFACAITAPC
jgi:flavin-dependent dehydrogenase